jgi:adenylylsulfate kinase
MAFETRRRSIVKSISWRIFAAIITSSVVYVMTGKGDFAAKVGAVDTAVKLFIYFLHERAWDRINYGRLPPGPDYEV